MLIDVKFSFVDEIQIIGKDLLSLIVLAGMCNSKTEAKKSILNKSIKINDITINDPLARLVLIDNQYIIVQRKSLV